MKIYRVSNVQKFAASIPTKQPSKTKAVRLILDDVKRRGDKAVLYHEKRFNKAARGPLRLSKSEIKRAYGRISKQELAALRLARARLAKTESATISLLKSQTMSSNGVKTTRKFVPIRSVGCYVPGGLARYPSSAVMCVVPASTARVKRIVVVSPPGIDGEIDSMTIAAADLCGAHEIYRMGGAQAIAALSYGTRNISRVDKIVGPGGLIVSEAKYLASRATGIDMLAGPTELGIMADGSANPRHVALDLVSQAEHSRDASCYIITDSQRLARSVQNILSEMLPDIKRRDIVKASLKNNGFIAVCKRSDMAPLANALAPEHLQVMAKNPASLLSKVVTPGMILIGGNSPSSASDYIMGSNHVLPTGGHGASRGSLSVLDFTKMITLVSSTKRALSNVSVHLQVLAEAEGLYNHYEAARGRL
ncbi:MAG: histidinol dehydrogenase [Nitrosopumilus sp. B06]|nr:MAG: histidinol dehydrogenase [Nitrosopumilus sp. B06]